MNTFQKRQEYEKISGGLVDMVDMVDPSQSESTIEFYGLYEHHRSDPKNRVLRDDQLYD